MVEQCDRRRKSGRRYLVRNSELWRRGGRRRRRPGINIGEVLQFDFGLRSDYDAGGNYSTGTFNNGTPVTSAQFDFLGFGGTSNSSINYTIHYTDGSSQIGNRSFTTNDFNDQVIAAAANKFIDYIEFSVASTETAGFIRLTRWFARRRCRSSVWSRALADRP